MFWCMFVPESRSFHCTALQSRSMMYVLYIKEICRFLLESAAHCKMRKIRLKIRRPLRSWGFDPPSRHHRINNLQSFPLFRTGAFRPQVANYVAKWIYNLGTEVLCDATSAEREEASRGIRKGKGKQHLVGSLCGRGRQAKGPVRWGVQ